MQSTVRITVRERGDNVSIDRAVAAIVAGARLTREVDPESGDTLTIFEVTGEAVDSEPDPRESDMDEAADMQAEQEAAAAIGVDQQPPITDGEMERLVADDDAQYPEDPNEDELGRVFPPVSDAVRELDAKAVADCGGGDE